MKKFDIHNWQAKHLNKSVNEGLDKTNAKLMELLRKAAIVAEMSFEDAEQERDTANPTFGHDVAAMLEKVWNGLSTGDMNDNSHADEIFK